MDSDYMSVHASSVWGGKRAQTSKYEGVDSPERIDLCLNHCPFPDKCHPTCCPYSSNSGEWKQGDGDGRRMGPKWPDQKERFLDLYGQGLTDKELAHEFGRTVRTIERWRRSCGLEANKGKPLRDPCLACNEISRRICKETRCICNEKARWQGEVAGGAANA